MFRSITTYYDEKNIERRNEYDICIQKNIDSKLFDEIIVLVEGAETKLPKFAKNLVVLYQFERPTFRDLFTIINERTSPTDINCIQNSDIYFDDSLLLVETQDMTNVCWALSRWDVDGNGNSAHWVAIDSQDAFIFQGPIKQAAVDNSYFSPGIPGCDNRLCFILNEAGYDVINPSKSIKAYHLHNSNIRNYDENNKVLGEYLLLEPTYLEIK